MKLSGKTLTFLAALGFLAPSSMIAVPQVTMGTFNAGSSGNYRADPNADLAYVLTNYALGKSTDGTWFGTFCVEGNEYFSSGSTYNVAFNDRALGGGLYTPTPGYDIISQGTAYLYSRFASGTLDSGTTYSYNNAASGLNLQKLIWWLEGEVGSGLAPADISTNPFTSILVAQFGSDLNVAKQDYAGSEVKVMNLTGPNGSMHQDQLVYLGTSQVPEGGWTVMLFGFGLLSAAILKRRSVR
jgi:hypothetical protein